MYKTRYSNIYKSFHLLTIPFKKKHVKNFSLTKMFRKIFFSLTASNIESVIPELLNSPENKDKNLLISLIQKASVIRPFSLTSYAEFVIKSIPELEYKSTLLSTLLDPDSEYPGSILLTYFLYKKNYFSSEEITNFITEKYQGFGNYKARYLIVIFSQLIKERNRDVFARECHNFYMTYAISGFSNIFTSFFQNLPEMTIDEFKSLISAPYGDVGNAIVNDNVDFLRENNINKNGRITPSFFMATDLGQQSPTFLQWSAFCGAEKCFQFLIENGADPSLNDRQGRSSLQYAAAGGNLNILKQLQKIVPDMDKAKETAVEYENIDIFNQI